MNSLRQKPPGVRSTRSVVDNRHERFGHARRILMLDDIAARRRSPAAPC